eukprot:g20223.t1
MAPPVYPDEGGSALSTILDKRARASGEKWMHRDEVDLAGAFLADPDKPFLLSSLDNDDPLLPKWILDHFAADEVNAVEAFFHGDRGCAADECVFLRTGLLRSLVLEEEQARLVSENEQIVHRHEIDSTDCGVNLRQESNEAAARKSATFCGVRVELLRGGQVQMPRRRAPATAPLPPPSDVQHTAGEQAGAVAAGADQTDEGLRYLLEPTDEGQGLRRDYLLEPTADTANAARGDVATNNVENRFKEIEKEAAKPGFVRRDLKAKLIGIISEIYIPKIEAEQRKGKQLSLLGSSFGDEEVKLKKRWYRWERTHDLGRDSVAAAVQSRRGRAVTKSVSLVVTVDRGGLPGVYVALVWLSSKLQRLERRGELKELKVMVKVNWCRQHGAATTTREAIEATAIGAGTHRSGQVLEDGLRGWTACSRQRVY